MPPTAHPPVPPVELPPARTVRVADRGEFFLRDTGDSDSARPVVMLLHGWMASADLNWVGRLLGPCRAGYRVLAIDHRGHGRGLRPLVPFRLADCAGDAAAVLESSASRPRPSSATRWAAPSPSSWLATTRRWSADWC